MAGNSGFDPEAYLAQKTASPGKGTGFDPNTYLAEKTAAPESSLEDKANTAYQGLLAGAISPVTLLSGGKVTVPKLAAFGQAYLSRDPSADVDEKLKAQGVKITQPDWYNYDQAVKENEAAQARQIAKDPGSYYGGQVAGSAPTVGAGAGLLKSAVTSPFAEKVFKGGMLVYGAKKLSEKFSGEE